jgi:hypothetical protein
VLPVIASQLLDTVSAGTIRFRAVYSIASVFTGNTFQYLPRLNETADNTERYILRDIRVTYINTVKFN